MLAKTIERIGLLTSGGDAPGMNAAIRAVVRTAIYNGVEVTGVEGGYSGLLEKRFADMQPHSVSKIISQGGTILKSSRCPEFKRPEVRAMAYENMRNSGINALIVIGGDGSLQGANLLCKEFGLPVVGIPGTIDNDIYGTDKTIGFDTSVNTAVSAIDKIKDTADSHNIIFFVEVMGRHSGFIAINTAISCGAEATLIPEVHTDIDALCNYMDDGRRKNKTSGIVVVAEGEDGGGAINVAERVKERLPTYDIRVTTLGHIQRGGSPTNGDRVLASVLGYEAVKALLVGRTGVMVGQVRGEILFTSLDDVTTRRNEIDRSWIEINRILSL